MALWQRDNASDGSVAIFDVEWKANVGVKGQELGCWRCTAAFVRAAAAVVVIAAAAAATFNCRS